MLYRFAILRVIANIITCTTTQYHLYNKWWSCYRCDQYIR